jgi:hypothetical protein
MKRETANKRQMKVLRREQFLVYLLDREGQS